MKVLGIDPGYGRCGVAVVEKSDGGKEQVIFSDCIETVAADEFHERLAAVSSACERLIAEYAPECIVLEKLFFQKNQKTAMHVAEVRGALIDMAARHELPLFEYTPGEVKSAVAGSGRADKKQIATMIRVLVKIEKAIRHDDEYDAIAVALTHIACARGTSSRKC